MARTIAWDLRIDWNSDGSYSDETDRLVAANGSMAFSAPESGVTAPRGTVDRSHVTLQNRDSRYSALNTSAALYSQIAGGNAYHAPMYLRVSVDGGSTYNRVFTGVIKMPREMPPAPGFVAQIELDCRSRDEILLNRRASTSLATFQQLHDGGATESDIIAHFLQDAGLPSGSYVLDPGMFAIPWAWLDDESPIEDCWMLAGACGGRFYCDPDGIFRYENMWHWLTSPHTTSQETLDVSSYGRMDGLVYDDRELYSAVTVEYAPRDVLATSALWEADSTVVVPANTTKTIVARLRQPAYRISSVNYTPVTSGGINLTSDVTIGLTRYAQRVELAITNNNPTYAAEIVALSLIGNTVSGAPSGEVNFKSTAPFWANYVNTRPGRTKLVRGNPYVQTEAQAAALGEFLRDRYQAPRLVWHLRDVPGEPGRRLGDRVTVANSYAMSSSRQGFITGINWRLSERGFVQDLDIIDATSLYPYGSYFILDTTLLGSGIRVFY